MKAISALVLRVLSAAAPDMPPARLLAAKLLGVYILYIGPYDYTAPLFLPFVPGLDWLGPVFAWHWISAALLACGALAILFGFQCRNACLLTGGILLFSVLLSRPHYANNILFFAVLFLALGLESRFSGLKLLRLQLCLVYLGAGLNKALEPDWRSGRFFAHWTEEILRLDFHRTLTTLWPAETLWPVVSMGVAAGEIGLACLVLFPGCTPFAVGLGLSFHLGLLAFTGGQLSWVFLYGAACAFLGLARWPGRPTVRLPANIPRHRALQALLELGAVWAPPAPDGRFEVVLRQTRLRGLRAACAMALHHPLSYWSLALAFLVIKHFLR